MYAEFVARLETLEPESSFPDEFGITFLGTGSAIPSKYRNVTGIFARLSHDHAMLLDCGEGTVGQLFRWLRTYNAFVEALTAIKCVFISHMHADHHLGLLRLLETRVAVCVAWSFPWLT